MVYFNTRDIAAFSLFGALWAVLSVTISPIFWSLTHLPFLCDMIGISILTLTLWWTRKFGAILMTGIIATIVTLAIRPSATHFFGFLAASLLLDILTRSIGYKRCLSKAITAMICLLGFSIISTAFAGVIIGALFMNPYFLTKMFGSLTFFAALHATGGVIGGVLGIVLIRALETRGVLPPLDDNFLSD
ncbi:hypothetical protein DRO56_02060 [Candidatus Bathyarchaeota archaeon]|nr:MAG: hypothetical protein DRO56_02060 [Candidatus Bathyarchaeota archaeon]